MMFRPIAVRALPGYRLWVRYADGVEGEVDLSHLAGRGVFTVWDEPGAFEAVYVSQSGAIAWSEDIDLCPDAVYMRITGKTPEQLFSAPVVAGRYA